MTLASEDLPGTARLIGMISIDITHGLSDCHIESPSTDPHLLGRIQHQVGCLLDGGDFELDIRDRDKRISDLEARLIAQTHALETAKAALKTIAFQGYDITTVLANHALAALHTPGQETP